MYLSLSAREREREREKPLELDVRPGKIIVMLIKKTASEGKEKTAVLFCFGGNFGIKKIQRNLKPKSSVCDDNHTTIRQQENMNSYFLAAK
jgi:hypothetical protein